LLFISVKFIFGLFENKFYRNKSMCDKGKTTLDYTIRPDSCPANTGTGIPVPVVVSPERLEIIKPCNSNGTFVLLKPCDGSMGGCGAIPENCMVPCSSSNLTTVETQTKNAEYFKLRVEEGEKCMLRKDLMKTYYLEKTNKKLFVKVSEKRYQTCEGKHLTTFVHITDSHIIQPGDPARPSFLSIFVETLPKRLADSFRPYEAFSCQVQESMVRQINAVARGPHLGQKFEFIQSTGDNTDSQSFSEIANFINLLDGKKVVPNPVEENYVGVQDNYPSLAYSYFYHPDCPPVFGGQQLPLDRYKTQFGYPDFPDILEAASKHFQAEGLKTKWYTCCGSHDVTKMGQYSLGYYAMFTLLDSIATGNIPGLDSMLIEALTPVQATAFIEALKNQKPDQILSILNQSLLRPVPQSSKRTQFNINDFIRVHFNTTSIPGPVGHGFKQDNIDNQTLYFTYPISNKIDAFVLNSCNFSGNLVNDELASQGGIGRNMLLWLETSFIKISSSYYNTQGQLVETNNEDKLAILFCHHTIETMNNVFSDPSITFDNDPQKITGEEFCNFIWRFPNVIALINGHEHRNKVTAFPDPSGKTQGFWEINTASHIDYPQQSRILEIADNGDDTLSIYSTMVNHAGPADSGRGEFVKPRSCCPSNTHSRCEDNCEQSSCNLSSEQSRCDTECEDTSYSKPSCSLSASSASHDDSISRNSLSASNYVTESECYSPETSRDDTEYYRSGFNSVSSISISSSVKERRNKVKSKYFDCSDSCSKSSRDSRDSSYSDPQSSKSQSSSLSESQSSSLSESQSSRDSRGTRESNEPSYSKDSRDSSNSRESKNCSEECYTDCKTKCKEEYTIEEIASISRELAYNDPFITNKFGDGENRTGTRKDRNIELLIPNPLSRCKRKCEKRC